MKIKLILISVLLFIAVSSFSQYIGVTARYTETRLVDDAPNPPKRQNRLVLSFYTVSNTGVYTPTTLNNFDIWIYKEGLQFGNVMGGVLDSAGNNYPGYSYTAPKAVAYYNSYQPNWIECDPYSATHYVVNGHELDCGFIGVSYWDMDYGTGEALERFTAPNICLPYYHPWEHPYGIMPGNVNFGKPTSPAPYNHYTFVCYPSTQQLILRGVLKHQPALSLPVKFTNTSVSLVAPGKVKVNWMNEDETSVNHYEIERSSDGTNFKTVGLVFPQEEHSGRAMYSYPDRISKEGVYYYRIKAVEKNGPAIFSAVLRINTANDLTVSLAIYPNPASSGRLFIEAAGLPAGRYVVSLTNMTGVSKRVMIIEHSGGTLSKFLPVACFASGIYLVELRSYNIRLNHKVIIE